MQTSITLRLAAICLLLGSADAALAVERGKPSDKMSASHDCDRLAAMPFDTSNPNEGVAFDDIDIEPAISACRNASRNFPSIGRYHTQLGRALLKAGRLGQAGRALGKARELSHPPAFALIGQMFERGQSVVKNGRKARKNYQQAADMGDVYGIYHLGRTHLKGIGGALSYSQGVELLTQAAEKGVVDAMYLLGEAQRKRDNGGKTDGVKWITKAANAGKPEAQSVLGGLYLDGGEVEQNDESAFEWTLKAARADQLESMYRLGILYLDGTGIQQSAEQAAEWLIKAGNKGHVKARTRLGVLYEQGNGVKLNYHEALKWLRQAASSGDVEAVYLLGLMYEQGKGVKKSSRRAMQFFRAAANKGHLTSQDRLLELEAAKVAGADIAQRTTGQNTKMSAFGLSGAVD